jgi:hypothetical protein
MAVVPAQYTFVVPNEGTQEHAVAIRGPGADESTQPIPGGAEQVELRPGIYELWRPVGDHRDRGMTQLRRVRSTAAPTRYRRQLIPQAPSSVGTIEIKCRPSRWWPD